MIRDADTGDAVAARIYLQSIDDGRWHFVERVAAPLTPVRYSRRNWIRATSEEHHTAVPAGSWSATIPPGRYRLTVERGHEYFAEQRELDVGEEPLTVDVPLRRWCDMAGESFYSGDLHVHRPLREVSVPMLADDVNVTLPLTSWVQSSRIAPTDPLLHDPVAAAIVPTPRVQVLDATHVIWPLNTEYEIFEVGSRRHTLGALFVLGHHDILPQRTPPWSPVIEATRREGSLFDFDKLDWPFGMLLPVLAPEGICELANNHVWRTEFAFRDWNTPAPAYMQPPHGGVSGDERQWVHYTLGMYYTLLNAGFRLPIGAGTATGVHPVPMGFSRVYVRVDGEFHFDKWFDGLRRGRSFMTTGPKVIAQLQDQWPGATLSPNGSAIRLQGRVLSEQPLTLLEVVVNGLPYVNLPIAYTQLANGSCETRFDLPLELIGSGWVAVRAFEDRPEGRFRFAHTNPWYVEVPGKPLRLRPEEHAYLVQRMEAEFERSRHVLSADSIQEYEHALRHYRQLSTEPVDQSQARSPRDRDDQSQWLAVMRAHGYTREEMLAALKIDPDELDRTLLAHGEAAVIATDDVAGSSSRTLRILPYPGGRHPRIGFLDGALKPQRDTKLSVFTPWDPASYVVIDLPEAVFTDLGLTYLAHEHVPTIWTQQHVQLPALEWQRADQGSFCLHRRLPNGIDLISNARAVGTTVEMELTLVNGTDRPLENNRAQVCVMLRGAEGFTAQTNQNKRVDGPVVACHDPSGQRWIITAWQPLHRAWSNAPCPCLHADPVLPACPAGGSVTARGWLTFYEGAEIDQEIERLKKEWQLNP